MTKRKSTSKPPSHLVLPSKLVVSEGTKAVHRLIALRGYQTPSAMDWILLRASAAYVPLLSTDKTSLPDEITKSLSATADKTRDPPKVLRAVLQKLFP